MNFPLDLGIAEKQESKQQLPPKPPQSNKSVIDRLKEVLPPIKDVVPDLKPKGGGELEGPCPKCGGTDRFYVRPDGSFGCRKCNPRGGDLVDFHQWINGNDLHGLADVWLTDRQPGEKLCTNVHKDKLTSNEVNDENHTNLDGSKLGDNNNAGNKKPKATAIEANLAAVYPYVDENGAELFQVCRYEKEGHEKTFRQRHRNGNGWTYNLKGVEPVLYRLPEVIRSNDGIVLTEGEKDVDNLVDLGFTATTSPMGASNWKPEYAEYLRGKHVAILPDNDVAGQRYLDKILPTLQGVAASIRVVKVPVGKDVSDWIAAGATKEEIRSAIEAAPEHNFVITAGGFQFIHAGELLKNLRPIEWSIDGIQPTNSMYYIFGDPGTHKTFIELDKGLCIASGIPYHGHATRQGTVFYICGEGQQGIGRRLAAWFISHKIKAANTPFFVAKTPMRLSDTVNVEAVMRTIDSMTAQYGPPALVIIDTLARNFGDGDENSTRDMGMVIQNLDRYFGNDFCRGLIHHTGHLNKDRGRGSMALKGAVDTEFRCSITSDDKILLECIKQKDAPKAAPMLFEPREIKLLIGEARDSSLVLDLVAEGDDIKTVPAANMSDQMVKALDILKAMGGSSEYREWRHQCIKKKLYKRSDVFDKAAERMRKNGLIFWDLMKNEVFYQNDGPVEAGGK